MSNVPPDYVKTTSFTTLATQPITISGLPGSQMDSEFSNVATSVNQTIDRLSLIQKDDGLLRNGVVGLDSLSVDAKNALAVCGAVVRGTWVASTTYEAGDVVVSAADKYSYLCVTTHTSSSDFDADFLSNVWAIMGYRPATNSLAVDTFTAGVSQTVYTLSNNPVSENNTQVFINGVYQSKTAYSVSGLTLTLTTAPATGAKVEVVSGIAAELINNIVTIPANSVGTLGIVDLAVTAAKIEDLTITTGKLADQSVTSAKIQNNTVGSTKITDLAIIADKLAGSAVTTEKLALLSVTAPTIAVGAVETAKIADGAVTTAKLASNAIVYNARTLANGGGQGGTPMTFHYSGQGGQPTWVWGSNDGGGGNNNYVWNPANFYVAYATNAGYATSSSSADYATRAALGPVNGTFGQDHTSGASKIYVGGFGVNKGHGIHFKRAAAEAASALHFERENGVVSGSIVQNASGGIAYNSASDYRLKEDLIPVSDGLLKVNSLKPTNFKWIDIDSRIDGFIAHEVKDVIPNAVTGEKDDVDENNDPIYQQIDQSKLIPIMVAAIQELSRKVVELESRLTIR